jgi:hypothetical protein
MYTSCSPPGVVSVLHAGSPVFYAGPLRQHQRLNTPVRDVFAPRSDRDALREILDGSQAVRRDVADREAPQSQPNSAHRRPEGLSKDIGQGSGMKTSIMSTAQASLARQEADATSHLLREQQISQAPQPPQPAVEQIEAQALSETSSHQPAAMSIGSAEEPLAGSPEAAVDGHAAATEQSARSPAVEAPVQQIGAAQLHVPGEQPEDAAHVYSGSMQTVGLNQSQGELEASSLDNLQQPVAEPTPAQDGSTALKAANEDSADDVLTAEKKVEARMTGTKSVLARAAAEARSCSSASPLLHEERASISPIAAVELPAEQHPAEQHPADHPPAGQHPADPHPVDDAVKHLQSHASEPAAEALMTQKQPLIARASAETRSWSSISPLLREQVSIAPSLHRVAEGHQAVAQESAGTQEKQAAANAAAVALPRAAGETRGAVAHSDAAVDESLRATDLPCAQDSGLSSTAPEQAATDAFVPHALPEGGCSSTAAASAEALCGAGSQQAAEQAVGSLPRSLLAPARELLQQHVDAGSSARTGSSLLQTPAMPPRTSPLLKQQDGLRQMPTGSDLLQDATPAASSARTAAPDTLQAAAGQQGGLQAGDRGVMHADSLYVEPAMPADRHASSDVWSWLPVAQHAPRLTAAVQEGVPASGAAVKDVQQQSPAVGGAQAQSTQRRLLLQRVSVADSASSSYLLQRSNPAASAPEAHHSDAQAPGIHREPHKQARSIASDLLGSFAAVAAPHAERVKAQLRTLWPVQQRPKPVAKDTQPPPQPPPQPRSLLARARANMRSHAGPALLAQGTVAPLTPLAAAQPVAVDMGASAGPHGDVGNDTAEHTTSRLHLSLQAGAESVAAAAGPPLTDSVPPPPPPRLHLSELHAAGPPSLLAPREVPEFLQQGRRQSGGSLPQQPRQWQPRAQQWDRHPRPERQGRARAPQGEEAADGATVPGSELSAMEMFKRMVESSSKGAQKAIKCESVLSAKAQCCAALSVTTCSLHAGHSGAIAGTCHSRG